ncbi:MAG: GMC family oxidoreductase [Gemmatimonadota bacterium]|nr:GMC family oxidoreductase [Gemmatimonadota bacterium]
MVRQERYDAIVVGSGITGGWAAKELTERGMRILVLEAGRPIDPELDYVMLKQPYELRFRGRRDRTRQERERPIQRTCYACDEWSEQFFVRDDLNPYTTAEGKPFSWIRSRQVGGRSIVWGRQVYRLSDLDFEANARDGHGVDWPIRYTDLAPWYDHVERFIGVSGRAEGLAQLPDSRFLAPMELNCAEQLVRERLMRPYEGDRVLTIGRCAILSEDHRDRQACHYCGTCERGCTTHSYFSSLAATLPAAAATGRMTLRPHSIVHSVVHDPATGRAAGVRVIDAETGDTMEFRGRLLFMCASALESARILLNSANERWPDGLANSSGQLGRNLMDHTMGGGASGLIDGLEDKWVYGRRPNGIYLPRFRNVTDQHPDFLRGYAYQGGASRAGWGRGNAMSGFGADFKHALREPGPWRMRFYGFGECLPRESNYVTLDPNQVDAWGIPALQIHCQWSENERAALKDMSIQAAEMLETVGARDVESFKEDNPPGLTIHEMGTARMGRDPDTSVLNGWNQSWDVPNLFITDGACMTSSGNQNPSLTYMALTARAVDHAVKLVGDGEL